MKGYIVLIIIFLSVLISGFLFYQKHDKEVTIIDLLKTSLGKTITQDIPTNTPIGVYTSNKDSELFGKVRYVLAPRILLFEQDTIQTDTTLFIEAIELKDSLIKNKLQDRIVINSISDDKYYYLLTKKIHNE